MIRPALLIPTQSHTRVHRLSNFFGSGTAPTPAHHLTTTAPAPRNRRIQRHDTPVGNITKGIDVIDKLYNGPAPIPLLSTPFVHSGVE